jgi:glycosyltransferase involved in cell wall biosynthesis
MPGRSILHVVTTIEMGGIETLVRDLAALQTRAGHIVHVCCAGGRAGVLAHDFADLGVPVHVPAGYRRLRSLPRFTAGIWRILGQVRPDVIHVHTETFAALVPILLARLRGVRAIVRSAHSCLTEDRGVRWLWRRLEVALCALLETRLVAVSTDVRRARAQHLQLPPVWYTVIYNGVDTARFAAPGSNGIDPAALIGKQAERERVFLITCVARLQPPKNPELLVRAMAELVRRDCPREAHLLLAGTGDLEPGLQRLTRELGLTDRVHLLGLRQDVPALLRQTDLFALASHTEAFGISVVEAMAAGKAVVATDVPGLREIIVHGQTGLLVAAQDPAAFADALERLLRDAALREAMGQAGRARAEQNYSLAACAAAYEDLYAQT